jgi:hypothetical protein
MECHVDKKKAKKGILMSELNLPAQYEGRYSSCESLARMFLFYRVCQYS